MYLDELQINSQNKYQNFIYFEVLMLINDLIYNYK